MQQERPSRGRVFSRTNAVAFVLAPGRIHGHLLCHERGGDRLPGQITATRLNPDGRRADTDPVPQSSYSLSAGDVRLLLALKLLGVLLDPERSGSHP